jgi:hypothetical protein
VVKCLGTETSGEGGEALRAGYFTAPAVSPET